MEPTNLLFLLVCLPLGLLAGGIINWLSDDLPHHLRLTSPHYPDGTGRPRSAWSGLIATLNGQRKAPSGARLGWRYPAVEIVMIVLYGYIALAFPVSGQSVLWLINSFTLMLITVIDLEHRLILYVVIVPGCLVALLGSALLGRLGFQDYLIGGALGFGIFFLFYLGGILFTVVMANARGEDMDEVAFGFGDVLVATLAGFILGWQALLFAMMLTVFLGAIGAVLFLLVQYLGKGKYEMFTALPYGQYIVLGTLIMMIWREPIRLFLQGGRP